MIVPMSKRFLKRSFEKTRYRWQDKPEPEVNGPFGVYVHVPFCKSLCSFCPFYKELYDYKKLESYFQVVLDEIGSSGIEGKADWLYFGGGTPNMLTARQVADIKDKILETVEVGSIGIELMPDILEKEYIKELRIAKFTKVSLGIESLRPEVMGRTGRKVVGRETVKELLDEINYRGLWSNLDFMIGLPGQDHEGFLQDISEAVEMGPSQITTYPLMQIGNAGLEGSMEPKHQYETIEAAGEMLSQAGYDRSGIWTWSMGDDVYDSSRDELVHDYFGFGPGAFSTYGRWKVVNPELDVYLKDRKAGKKRAFVAPRIAETDAWRLFARKLYDMDFSSTRELGKDQLKVYKLLSKSGFIDKDGKLTDKGIIYAHDITRTVVENLPYPLQNPDRVDNHDEYLAEKDSGLLG